MKKSLIALAVLAASGASFAQSSVTLYGTIDAALTSTKTGDTTTTRIDPSAFNTSVYGFKGSEDLGGGLKANFKLENQFNPDTGASKVAGTAFSREAWVGLSGSFGEVRLGKVSSAYNDPEGAAAPALGANSFSPFWYVFRSDERENSRPTNTIYYATPTFSGVTGSASVSLREAGTDQMTTLGLQYEAGPLYVGVGYQGTNRNSTNVTERLTQLNVTYDFKVVKLVAAAGHVSNYNFASGGANDFAVGVDVPLSSALVLSTGLATSKLTNTGAADIKHDGFGLDVAYHLSKRTQVYAGVETDTVKQAGIADLKNTVYGLGVTHKF